MGYDKAIRRTIQYPSPPQYHVDHLPHGLTACNRRRELDFNQSVGSSPLPAEHNMEEDMLKTVYCYHSNDFQKLTETQKQTFIDHHFKSILVQ